MSRLGSVKRPLFIRVQTWERAAEVMRYCDSKGWKVVAEVEPDKPENLDDIKIALKQQERGVHVPGPSGETAPASTLDRRRVRRKMTRNVRKSRR